MHEEIRRKAKKRVEAKKGFYIVALIFAAISLILYVVSATVPPEAVFWIRFPILILGLVLGIIYLAIFGFPGSKILSQDWQEEEMEKEMARLYREKQSALPSAEDLTEEDRLELKELERLKQKWDREGEGYV